MSGDLYVRGVAPVARLLLMVIYLSLSSTPHPFFPVYVGKKIWFVVKRLSLSSTLVSQTLLFPALYAKRVSRCFAFTVKNICRKARVWFFRPFFRLYTPNETLR